MSYVRSLLLFFVVTGLSMPLFAQEQAPEDSLRSAGLLRPNNFVGQNARWNRASTDLFTYWLNSGLYGYYGAQPEVLLDGIPIDANYFGWQNLNMLPLFVDSIEKSESRFSPQVYKNTLASSGLIDFKTATPDTGFSIRSTLYIGNESGDPGPFVFDSSKTTPNIDRWGPDGGVLLSYREQHWYAKGLFSFRNHQQTDLISNQRIHLTASALGTNQEFVNYKIQTTAKSGLLETGYETNSFNVKARAIYGEDRDYLFLQPFGREIPTKTAYNQFALQGDYRTGDWLLEGLYLRHSKTIGKRYELHTFIFDWDQTTHTFSASALYETSDFNLKPGIIYERLNTRAPGIDQPFNDLATFFLDGRLLLGAYASLDVHANVDYDEERFGNTLKIGLPVNINQYWKIKPEYFQSELLPLRQNSFAYWVGQGYTFAEELGITAGQPRFESFQNQLTGIQLTNEFYISDRASLTLEQQLIHHDALNVPWQIVRENEFLDTQPGSFTATSEQGTRLSFLAQFKHSVSSWLHHQLTLHLQRTSSGSVRYIEYYEQVPETKINYTLDVYPTKDLILSAQTTYRSSTKWLEYTALEGVEYKLPSGIPIRPFSGTFRTTTPAFTNITISAEKWFWDRRLNAQFSVQNLLNEEVRTHTLGAELFTKFDIKLSLNF